VLRDYEKGYEEMVRRMEKEDNEMYRREELPRKFTEKMLYG